MLYLQALVHWIFFAYTILLFIRVVGSWFPSFASHPFMGFVFALTEPYLKFFRRIIPPIRGVLDLSPLLAFFSLSILERIISRLLFFRV